MKKWNFICCLATLVLFMMSSCSDSIKPVNLRTDYLVNPIGLDNQTPQFTWEYSSKKKDVTNEIVTREYTINLHKRIHGM